MEKAYKKLGTNLSLFAISSFGTKIISFLLVPLYTNCLSTAEYGTADMLSTVVQLLLPVFTLDIADSVIRFVLDNNTDREGVFFTAIRIILMGSSLLAAILFFCYCLRIFQIPAEYYVFIFFCYFFTSCYNTLTNYFRGCGKIVDIVISGLMSILINGLCNLLFLLKFGMGLTGYLYANLWGVAIPVAYLLIRARRYGFLKLRTFRIIDKGLQKEMLHYCTPLIINGLSWWINNSLDRLFVTGMCGIDANGLLAVAYKIPSILAMFQTIFNQAWAMSAVQEFDPEDRRGFLGKTYTYYGSAMIMVCGMILLCNIPLARLLYAKDFFQAWKYTGMLVLAHLFGAMSICISGVFNAVKDSKSLAFSTMLGAIVNTILNAVLIYFIGVTGAPIATLISNIVIWIYRMRKSRNYVRLRIYLKRDIAAYLLLILMCCVGLTKSHLYLLQVLVLIVIWCLYRHEEGVVLHSLSNRLFALIRRK